MGHLKPGIQNIGKNDTTRFLVHFFSLSNPGVLPRSAELATSMDFKQRGRNFFTTTIVLRDLTSSRQEKQDLQWTYSMNFH